ncbi:MAG: site-2 protease family protein [Candidatus Moranbacteria bacterium]|nr:site-2 protease family protein [Candidatus Moranbacteria bacterium]
MNHIDPIGSIVVPTVMFLTTGFAFGWAKPVPYNPYNLRNQKWGPALVALAGPMSNISLALLAVIVGRLLPLSVAVRDEVFLKFLGIISGAGSFADRWGLFASSLSGSYSRIFFALMLFVIFWNVLLAFFNLIPIPPLDGSKLLYATFSFRQETILFLERYGFFILLFVIFFLSTPVSVILDTALGFFFGLLF